MFDVADRCPQCGLIILSGNLFDAVEDSRKLGPTLGITEGADAAAARAGYVGIGSLFVPHIPELYRCPRCKTNVLVEVEDDSDDQTGRVGGPRPPPAE